MPAAYVTLALVILAAPWFLVGGSLATLRMQALGAVGFFSNFVFSGERGYFSSASELGPLLHFWSLSLEEQFYFIFPLLLAAAGLKFRRWMIPLLLLASLLALYKAYLIVTPTQSYYLLPTRIWQFALGGVGFLIIDRFGKAGILPALLGPLAYLLLIALLLFAPVPAQPGIGFHPGIAAGVCCLLTLAMLTAREHKFWQSLAAKPITWTGDISYSLYLMHWPTIAFYRNHVARTELNVTEALGLIAASLTAGTLLHYAIERPFHRMKFEKVGILFAGAFGGAAALAGLAFLVTASPKPPRNIENFGLAKACDMKDRFVPLPECRAGDGKKVLLWGDSFAMHLTPGWPDNSDYQLIQATKSGCAPILGISPKLGTWDDKAAQRCITFNSSVMQFALSDDDLDLVVLSTPWKDLIESHGKMAFMEKDGGVFEFAVSNSVVVEKISAMVERLRISGKRVVLVAPPPRAAFDPALCLEQQQQGLASALPAGCPITAQNESPLNADISALVTMIEDKAKLPIFKFDKPLCQSQRGPDHICKTRIKGVPLYLDEGHFTPDGFKILAEDIGFAEKISGMAR